MLGCALLPGAAVAACIGLVPASGHPFWLQVEAGAREAARKTGVDLYVRGPSREGQVETQLQLIEKVMEHGCKALIIAPSGPEIGDHVGTLKAEGVQTFYIDRDVGGIDVEAVVATDNYLAGQEAGRYLAQVLGGQGRVGVIRVSPAIASTSERQRGFLQAAKAAGLNVVFDQALGDDPEATFDALRQQLPTLDGLFTSNGVATRATYAALLRLNATHELTHVGFDTSQQLFDALKAGHIRALMIQQAYAMGYQSVRLAQRALAGERIEPQRRQVELQAVLVTRDNLERSDIKALLALPLRP
ncbi:substrate-binding domain-containing protein [Pseudomonas sp.]|uniref:substrate-binding domain-containing protein n=1 Tax=Pseudomonas sp. TaxID=306 RepID=UPI003D1222AF